MVLVVLSSFWVSISAERCKAVSILGLEPGYIFLSKACGTGFDESSLSFRMK